MAGKVVASQEAIYFLLVGGMTADMNATLPRPDKQPLSQKTSPKRFREKMETKFQSKFNHLISSHQILMPNDSEGR